MPARPAASRSSCATASRSATSSSSGRSTRDAFDATYLGEDGQAHPIVMGSYGIGVGRNVACIVEAHHDDKGIVWPAEVAPYAGASRFDRRSQGAARRSRSPSASTTSPSTPAREILWDDRDESPGVKFTDAELLGHALDPDRQPAFARGGRRRGHGACDRGALDPADRGRRGDAQSSLSSLVTSSVRLTGGGPRVHRRTVGFAVPPRP